MPVCLGHGCEEVIAQGGFGLCHADLSCTLCGRMWMEGLLLPSPSGNGANSLVVLLGKCPTKGWAGQDRACCKGAAPMSKESRL